MPINPSSSWEKSSQDLVDLFAALAPSGAGIEQRKMFGWPYCFVNGNLFAGLHKQSMMFHLSEKDQAAFLRQSGAVEFEPMPGRKMKGYVALENPLTQERSKLKGWIDQSLQYALGLPAKSKKAAKSATKASIRKNPDARC